MIDVVAIRLNIILTQECMDVTLGHCRELKMTIESGHDSYGTYRESKLVRGTSK